MSAHTPGPWEVFWIESSAGTSARITTTDGKDVAHIPMPWNALGDAPLLAAAPDLWAALREAVQCAPHAFMCTPSVELRERLKRGEVIEMTLGKELPGCDCWKSRAAAAIAKAEGR